MPILTNQLIMYYIDIPVKQLIYTHQNSLKTLDILICINMQCFWAF
jgi:hypothetical protein